MPGCGGQGRVVTLTQPADARAGNWQFIVPDDTAGMPALVVPDLGACVHEWLPRGAASALAALCGQVADGGRICVGFANPRYPLSPGRAGALSLARAGRVLADAGMNLERTFVALPVSYTHLTLPTKRIV